MATLTNFTFEELAIGQSATWSRVVTAEAVQLFAAATGDVNPVHLDEEFAATTAFRGRIAHGMYTAGLISAAIALVLPGPGTVYLGQQLSFDRPVRVGDSITVELTVTGKTPGPGHVELRTIARNQKGKIVVSGTATVQPGPRKLVLEQPAEPRFVAGG